MQHRHAARRQRGLSLVEAAVCLAVSGILVGAAVPGWGAARERAHIDGAAAQFETDFKFARSEAVSRGVNVHVGFEAGSAASCYVVHTGKAGDCTCLAGAAPVCRAGASALRTVRYEGAPLSVQSNQASMLIEPVRGAVTLGATVKFIGASGQSVREIVSQMGRVRSCSPGGQVAGHKAC